MRKIKGKGEYMKNVFGKITMGLALGASLNAFAAGTTAGTTVDLSASVSFSTGGVSQTPSSCANGSGCDTARFVVDRKVIFTLTKVDSAYVTSHVVPGQTNDGSANVAYLTYDLYNTSNATEDFILTPTNQNGGTDAFAGTDSGTSHDPTLAAYVASVTGTGTTFNGSTTDSATRVSNLAADTHVHIYVVATIPSTALDAELIGVNLEAKAAVAGGGSAEVATSTDSRLTQDVVLAETTGTGLGDSNYDGKIQALDAFKVVASSVTITKSSYVVWDPIDCTGSAPIASTNTEDSSCTIGHPKRIPGAVVHYEVTVTNSGSLDATSLTTTDTVDSNMTYLTGSSYWDGTAQNDSTGPNTTYSGGVVTTIISTLTHGPTSKVTKFRATVN